MEIRIKTGEKLKCEYTGKEYGVLVKIYPTTNLRRAGGDVDKGGLKTVPETLWLGRDALENALRMIDSSATPYSPQPMQPVARPDASGIVAPIVAPSPRVVGQNVKDPAEVIDAFRVELLELIKNPPKVRDSEQEGLGELHVIDLIKRFLPTFKNSNAMLPVLQKELGMDRNRFDIIMNKVGFKKARG